MRLKLPQKEQLRKWAEATSDLIGNKIDDSVARSYDGRTRKISQNTQQNNSETNTNENDKEIPKERYISPEKRQEIINDLRLK